VELATLDVNCDLNCDGRLDVVNNDIERTGGVVVER